LLGYKNTAFPESEYRQRVIRTQKAMKQKGLDLLLCHEIGNICWLCGVQCVCWNKYFMLAVPAYGDPKLLIQSFERYGAYLYTWLAEDDIIPYLSCENEQRSEDPIEASIKLVKNMGYEKCRIGLEYSTPCPGLSASDFDRIKNGLPVAEFIDASGLVENVRTVKSKPELEYMKQAAGMASRGMTAVMEAAHAGMTDNDLAAVALGTMTAEGSEYMCLDPIITIGPRSGVPHTTYGRHRIEQGDTGLLEISGCVNRYSGVTMRAVSFGEPADDVKFMIEGCLNSVNTVIENMKAGAVCSEIAHKAEAKLEKQLQKYMWHGIYGYTIGLGFPPRWDDSADIFIMKGYDNVLEPDMTFHVSTTLRDLGRRSITVSETVAVTGTGCEVYTSVPRMLFIK
jgi:Xaa-Pro dipeptidase